MVQPPCLILCVTVLFVHIAAVQSSSTESRLEKEYLANPNPFKIDTISRFYFYNSNGVLSEITDSPRVNQFKNPTYDAHCDSIGRIIKVNSRRNAPDIPELTPKISTSYYWLSDHRVAYASRDTDNVVLDSGTIQAFGEIRIVRLPQSVALPTVKENQLIVLISDSTGLFDKDGKRINTYHWQFDSLGNDTVWYYQLPGEKKKWLQSYTNVYYPDGRLKRRFPAMESTISYYFYSAPVHVSFFTPSSRDPYSIHPGKTAPSRINEVFLLNGKKVPLKAGGNNGSMMFIAPDKPRPQSCIRTRIIPR